jgi:hypothetical protein
MPREAAGDLEADRRDLGKGGCRCSAGIRAWPHVDSGRPGPALAVDAIGREASDDPFLEPAHQVAHAEFSPAQVEERVGDDLSGPVIRHLAAAFGFDHGDVAGGAHVFDPAGEAEREHRRMLGEPEFIVGRRAVSRSEFDVPAHAFQGIRISGHPDLANGDHRRRGARGPASPADGC